MIKEMTDRIQKNPNDIQAHTQLGRFYLQKEKNYNLAKHHFNEALKLNPDHAAALLGLINTERESGNNEEAFALAQDTIKKFPEHPHIHFQYTNLYTMFYENETEKVFQLLLNLEKQFPTFPESHLKLGRFYLQKEKNYNLAKHHFKEALKLNPDHAAALLGLINSERESGNNEEAFALAQDAIMKFPKDISINNAYINVLIAQDRKDDAIEYLEKFKEPFLPLRLIDLYTQTKSYDKALSLLSTVDKKDNTDEQKLLKKCVLYHRLDNFQMVMMTITKAYELFPESLDVNLMLGEYLFHWVSKKEGYRQLEKTQERFETDPKIILSKCSMLNRDGKRMKISQLLKEAFSQFNSHPGISQRLFSTLIEEGNFTEAKALLVTLQTQKILHKDILLQLEGNLSLKQWDLEKAYHLFHQASIQSPTLIKNYHQMSTVNLLTFRIEEAFEIQKSMSQDQTTAVKNPTQNLHGQLLNEFHLEKALCRDLCQGLLTSNTKLLRDAVLNYPDNIASSIAWLIHLRQSNLFTTISKQTTSSIPKHLIHFWDKTELPEDIAELINSWKVHNPSWKEFIFDDILAKAFIKEHFDATLLKIYTYAISPANKSDIFRLAALYVLGGVYADADDRCNGSLEPLIRHYNFVGYQEYIGSCGNNFLAISPKHPIIRSALDAIIEDFEAGTTESIWLSSGPGLITRKVSKYIAENFEAFKESKQEMILYNYDQLSQTIGMHCFAHYKTTTLHWIKSEFTN